MRIALSFRKICYKKPAKERFFIINYLSSENLSQTNDVKTPIQFETLIGRFKKVQKQLNIDDTHKTQQIIISLGIIKKSLYAGDIKYARARINQLNEFINKEINVLKAKLSYEIYIR